MGFLTLLLTNVIGSILQKSTEEAVQTYNSNRELERLREVLTEGYTALEEIPAEFPDMDVNAVRVPVLMNVVVDLLIIMSKSLHVGGMELSQLLSIVRPFKEQMDERQLEFYNSDAPEEFEEFYETSLFDKVADLPWLEWSKPTGSRPSCSLDH